jgi:hypothetical protein
MIAGPIPCAYGGGTVAAPERTGPTAAVTYAWVNARQVWAAGTVNVATGKIHIEGFMQ